MRAFGYDVGQVLCQRALSLAPRSHRRPNGQRNRLSHPLSYGDIAFNIRDVEGQIVRLLERKLLSQLPLLHAAQSALAEVCSPDPLALKTLLPRPAAPQNHRLMRISHLTPSQLDAHLALACCARDLHLVKPTLVDDDTRAITIQSGWHPLLASDGAAALVPNDCEIGTPTERLMLLTGPNASGKTVYLRTVALIVYLAHVGSYVPAASATVARTDAIHTRMHSKESAAIHQSAFMLDLSQMANVFKHSTSRTLCVIDEFGKGTNAQDGISLLYASLHELLERGAMCPRVLACTHYTEVLDIRGFREQPGIALWTMQVLIQPKNRGGSGHDLLGSELLGTEEEMLNDDKDEAGMSAPHECGAIGGVVYLYKAARGECQDSFGPHCAQVAGLPPDLIQRARDISHCRAIGRPIERLDVDSEESLANEKQLYALVERFLTYDFASHTVSAFLSANVPQAVA